MAGTFSHTCRCGTVALELDVPGAASGTRVMCYCRDCRTAARHFGGDGALLAPTGGTDVWQTTPDRIAIRQGQDRLAVLRLSPKGIFRWYAACCDTPLVNTLPRLSMPFVGLVLRPGQGEVADPVLGPVYCHAFTASAPPGCGAPAKDVRFVGAGLRLLVRMLGAWGSGRAGRNPFRGADGGPVAPIRILTREERRAACPA